jgi:hypothetical protein
MTNLPTGGRSDGRHSSVVSGFISDIRTSLGLFVVVVVSGSFLQNDPEPGCLENVSDLFWSFSVRKVVLSSVKYP